MYNRPSYVEDKIRANNRCCDCDALIDKMSIRCAPCMRKHKNPTPIRRKRYPHLRVSYKIDKERVNKRCCDCDVLIDKTSERCPDCNIKHKYPIAKKRCADCDKIIPRWSNKSGQCQKCMKKRTVRRNTVFCNICGKQLGRSYIHHAVHNKCQQCFSVTLRHFPHIDRKEYTKIRAMWNWVFIRKCKMTWSQAHIEVKKACIAYYYAHHEIRKARRGVAHKIKT